MAEDDLLKSKKVNEDLRKQIIMATTQGLKIRRDADRDLKSAGTIKETSRTRELELHMKFSAMTNESNRLQANEREFALQIKLLKTELRQAKEDFKRVAINPFKTGTGTGGSVADIKQQQRIALRRVGSSSLGLNNNNNNNNSNGNLLLASPSKDVIRGIAGEVQDPRVLGIMQASGSIKSLIGTPPQTGQIGSGLGLAGMCICRFVGLCYVWVTFRLQSYDYS
tara:strand:+ start:24 stop:695 length:672 start_codon:yes stop_codon:yes gene_type:complete